MVTKIFKEYREDKYSELYSIEMQYLNLFLFFFH